MSLSEPKVVTFWISAGLVTLGLLASQGILPGQSAYALRLAAAGFIVLAPDIE